MTNIDVPKPNKNEIDPAALAIVALAATVSVIAPSGPYGPGCMMIGVTIFCVVFGYDVAPRREWRQSLAFSVVCALISLLTLGYPLELIFATHRAARLHILIAEVSLEKDITHSEVPPWFILALWMVMVVLFYRLDKWRCGRS